MPHRFPRSLGQVRELRLRQLPVRGTSEQAIAIARLQPAESDVQRVDVAAVAIEQQDALIAVFQKWSQQIAEQVDVRIHLGRKGSAEPQVVAAGPEPERRQQQDLLRSPSSTPSATAVTRIVSVKVGR